MSERIEMSGTLYYAIRSLNKGANPLGYIA